MPQKGHTPSKLGAIYRPYHSPQVEGSPLESAPQGVSDCSETVYRLASLAAIWATWRHWKRAMASSFSLGWRSPRAPASVVAP